MKTIYRDLRFIYIILCIISLSHTLLHAQENNLKFNHITLDDGLSHSKVNCIFQDSQGFLWFGTNGGLNKYDGNKITTYQRDLNNETSISADLIRDIVEDSRNRLWISTAAGGLNLYDRDRDQFTRYTNDSTSAVYLSHNDINVIEEDHNGNLWLGTRSGIIQFNYENQSAQTWLVYPEKGAGSYWNLVSDLCVDRDNILWIGTYGGGLTAFDLKTQTFEHFRNHPHNPQSLSHDDVRTIYEDKSGNLWIGTYEGGLNLFDKRKKQFTSFCPDIKSPENMTIRGILEDDHGNLWMGTRSGIYHFNSKTHRFIHYYNDSNNPYSLCHNIILTLHKDAKGDLWIGTRGGISFLNTNTSAFTHFRAHDNNKQYLNHKVVYAILEDKSGDLWFGTEEGGLNYLNRATGNYTYYIHDPANASSIGSNNIKALLEDRQGKLWIGTYQGGISVLDRKSNKFTRYIHDPKNPYSLYSNDIETLFEDDDGDIWIGTTYHGLDFYNASSGRFMHFNLEDSNNGTEHISAIIQDQYGYIWLGAGESLICRINKRTKEILYYHLPTNQDGIGIGAILEDRQGDLWFATSGGLFVFNHSDSSFTRYTKDNNLPSNIILGIMEDESGILWLSTSHGISRFNPQTTEVKNYYKENGLQSNQFTRACMKSRTGQLFFGGINGVTAFYPDAIQDNTYIPPVVFTDFLIFNKSIKDYRENDILQRNINQTREIKLSHKHSVFTFEFAALNYAISKHNQYAFILENFEKEWNFVGNRNFATYTNLNPGEYTFRVKAANNDGLWNETGSSIKICITPSFYKTRWFKLILISLFAFMMLHFYNFQKQKRNLLEAKSRAQSAQLKLLRAQMNPHFLFNALSTIRSMILINKDQAWQMVTKLAEFFRYSLQNYDKIEVTLREEIEAARNYLAIEKIRFKDILDITFHIDENSLDCIVPAFIIQPLFENAIRHSKHTGPKCFKVCMDIRYENNNLFIDISNTGKLEENYQRSQSGKKDHGYSLDNIQKRIQLMFKEKCDLNLYEKNGWVHTEIKITYPQ